MKTSSVSTRDRNKEINENSRHTIFNLIAVGAFIWFLGRTLGVNYSILFRELSIYFNLDGKKVFWFDKLGSAVITLVLIYLLTRHYWKLFQKGNLNTKRVLIRLGVFIVVLQAIQFVQGMFIDDWLVNSYMERYRAYNTAYREMDQFGIIGSIRSFFLDLASLALLIRWRF